MKLLFIFLLMTFLSIHNYSQENNKMEKINSIIQELKDKFAPDKRTAVFNFEAVESENKIIIKNISGSIKEDCKGILRRDLANTQEYIEIILKKIIAKEYRFVQTK